MMKKYLSRKFLIALLMIILCAVAFLVVDNGSAKALCLIVGGVVAICYIFAEMITDISETDMMDDFYEPKTTIGFKEDSNER